jgi:hypothetical protein
MLYDVAGSVPVTSRIGSGRCGGRYFLVIGCRGFAFAYYRRSRFICLISMLCVTGVAVHACRLVSDHRFNRVREDAFALATPTINRSANFDPSIASISSRHSDRITQGESEFTLVKVTTHSDNVVPAQSWAEARSPEKGTSFHETRPADLQRSEEWATFYSPTFLMTSTKQS